MSNMVNVIAREMQMLTKDQQKLVQEYVRSMLPVDDEPLSEEEWASIERAEEEYKRGEYFTMEEIIERHGLFREDL